MSVIIEEDKIYIPKDPDCEKCGDNVIIHKDFTLYENACADIVATNGGNILEIGFGLGISANKIQTHNPNKHVIIEINEDIYNTAIEWAKDKDSVEVILGDWKDVIDGLKDKFDGVYNDADEDSQEDSASFAGDIKSKCNEGCVITQTVWGVNNSIYKNNKTFTTITLNDDIKKYFEQDTLDILYFTLTSGEWK